MEKATPRNSVPTSLSTIPPKKIFRLQQPLKNNHFQKKQFQTPLIKKNLINLLNKTKLNIPLSINTKPNPLLAPECLLPLSTIFSNSTLSVPTWTFSQPKNHQELNQKKDTTNQNQTKRACEELNQSRRLKTPTERFH